MRPFLLLPTLLAALGLLPAAASAGGGEPATIVQLTAAAACRDAAGLEAAGAHVVDAKLRLWRVSASTARTVVSDLRARGSLAAAQRERTYTVSTTAAVPEPLEPEEWWRAQIGIEGLTPPGPGVPVTIVDSGIDVTHPEFTGRPDTELLNAQEPQGVGGEHGTSVASVLAAPLNGVGIVGIYPQARLRSWDAARGAGTRLESSDIAAGILAAARAGKGVINLSIGGERDLPIELAVSEAVATGSLVVAASGNDGDRGSPIGFPAALPHVTTVAATGRAGAVATFSSRSPYVDIAAPGDDVLVASALGRDWRPSSGTSFSAPIVAGAAAWLWTARPDLDAGQVAEILRRSARDIDAPGRDPASGFGMLNVGAALAFATPIRDPFEPNDDIDEVDPAGDRNLVKAAALTTKSKQRARTTARVDAYEDPRDVYRVWLPARRAVAFQLGGTGDGDLSLHRSGSPTVSGRFAGTGRLARATSRGRSERLVYRNPGAGRWAYLTVRLPSGTLDATYTLSVGPSTGRAAT
ncbi:MAG TPA: S8 family serine peptidase [Gaiella sp.]|nr:S8 family serine peptidase [Gaiella sp.]